MAGTSAAVGAAATTGTPAAGGSPAAESTGRAAPGTAWHGGRTDWIGYVFVAFFAIPFVLFNIMPILFGIYVGFTDWSIIGTPNWVGLANFERALADEWVWGAFANTLIYASMIVPGVTVLALAFALFVNQGWPLSGLARTLFFAPNVVSATVIGLIWVWILDTQFGIVNQYLGDVGIDPVPWLTNVTWSKIGVSIASIWWDLGLAFILFLAALQGVPSELYEAAEVDGASRWQRFWHVTLPQIRPTLSMVVTLQLISTMRIFSQVYVMTNGGPAGSSASVIHYIYRTAISRYEMGYASAISMLLFVLILVVTLLQRFLLRERGHG
ncbi:MAG: sugar ABC transporter permease [Rhizobiales bacterium]|nr:sugar ABC transporter permease [Hyphomicrobiales bacterium]